jgi:hypothetical protein
VNHLRPLLDHARPDAPFQFEEAYDATRQRESVEQGQRAARFRKHQRTP